MSNANGRYKKSKGTIEKADQGAVTMAVCPKIVFDWALSLLDCLH
jgi:hypothetical protein